MVARIVFPQINPNLYSIFSDTTICTGCCSILDNIVSHIFKQLSLKGKLFYAQSSSTKDSQYLNEFICLILAFPAKKLRRNMNTESDMFLKVSINRH